jgi:hypothetical protein
LNWISSRETENTETSNESTETLDKEPSLDERLSRADSAGESGVGKRSIKGNTYQSAAEAIVRL